MNDVNHLAEGFRGLSWYGASEIAPIPNVLSGLSFAKGVELFREKLSHLYADYVS